MHGRVRGLGCIKRRSGRGAAKACAKARGMREAGVYRARGRAVTSHEVYCARILCSEQVSGAAPAGMRVWTIECLGYAGIGKLTSLEDK